MNLAHTQFGLAVKLAAEMILLLGARDDFVRTTAGLQQIANGLGTGRRKVEAMKMSESIRQRRHRFGL